MPTEARRITFSNAELYAALAGTGSGLPAGAITRVWGNTARDLVKINVAAGEGETAATVEFPATQVGEALIDYCLANRVPLPRAFSKSLTVKGDCVALEITNVTNDLIAKGTIWRRLIDPFARLSVRKQSLVRASVYGLAFQIVVLWLADQAWGDNQWGRVTFNLDSGTWQGTVMAISALLPGPLLFFVGAWARNAIVKRAKRPYRYSPKTLDFRSDEQATPLSTVFFALTLAFSIVVLGGPLVVSQFDQVLQQEGSTPSVTLSGPTPEGAFSSSPSSQSSPLAEPRSTGNGFGAGRSTDSGSPSPAMLVQKGTVKISSVSPIEVTYPNPFDGVPNVTVVNTDGSPADAVVENVTSNSFEVYRVAGADGGRSQIEVEWIAKGSSPK